MLLLFNSVLTDNLNLDLSLNSSKTGLCLFFNNFILALGKPKYSISFNKCFSLLYVLLK